MECGKTKELKALGKQCFEFLVYTVLGGYFSDVVQQTVPSSWSDSRGVKPWN